MTYKLSQFEMVGGMILLIPDKISNATAGGLVPARQEKDSGTGLIMACDLHPEMPDTYDPGNGQKAEKVSIARKPKVGDIVLYRRVSSQEIELENEDGSVTMYRVVHEADIAGYINPAA